MAVGMSRSRESHIGRADSIATVTTVADADGAIDPDDLPDGLVIADETGRVICFNSAAARITAVPGPPLSAARWNTHCRWRT